VDAGDPPVQALHGVAALSVAAGFYRTCVIDGLLEHSPAEHVRRPSVPAESPTLGFTHLQFEALLTAARESSNPSDFALVAMLGLLGLRIFEGTGADIADLGEEHGHRVLRVCGKGTKTVLVPLPPAVGRAIDRATGTRTSGPILLNSRAARMDRHAATRGLRRLAQAAGVRITRPHPHMLRHTLVTTMLDAGVDLRDAQVAARHADPRTTMRYDRARKNLDRGRPSRAAAWSRRWHRPSRPERCGRGSACRTWQAGPPPPPPMAWDTSAGRRLGTAYRAPAWRSPAYVSLYERRRIAGWTCLNGGR
jgi:site-specific recombinase XerD